MSLQNDIPDQDTINQNCPMCSGLPADDLDGLAEWVDDCERARDAEADAAFVQAMERGTAGRIASGAVNIMDAVCGTLAERKMA